MSKQRDNILIAIYFFQNNACVKKNLPRRVRDILLCSSPETGHGMAVVSSNGFSVAVYCILVIYKKKLSIPSMTL